MPSSGWWRGRARKRARGLGRPACCRRLSSYLSHPTGARRQPHSSSTVEVRPKRRRLSSALLPVPPPPPPPPRRLSFSRTARHEGRPLSPHESHSKPTQIVTGPVKPLCSCYGDCYDNSRCNSDCYPLGHCYERGIYNSHCYEALPVRDTEGTRMLP